MEVFEYKNVVIETPNSPQAEAYRKLELNIRMDSIDNPYKVIQITSATPEDGKTTTAINLAAVYAEKNKKVLLIDFDLRRPKIHRAFHKINDLGFYDFIVNEKPIEDLIIKDESKIDLLLTGNFLSSPHVILQSKKVSDLIDKFRNEYDVIIVDSPPILTVTDALLISDLVDGVVYVVSYKKTKKDQAKIGLKQLQDNGANIIGAVLSNIDVKKAKGFYNYYYYEREQ
ncbi:MAG: CpsD/CapB family tyrosine-protein kinase [Candidatus Izemoplasmatales bacterium]|jgi:capsular exopolysaccharide synthesis family protein|nr:CpsD/CapB family tyrosine-protein kinase [Candidatus Izemoplasmatales bacterium]MDD4069143.1 CpsD/CapB family tyrosine-protein kinase [Candidatus Izemoplasmatales bacterium]MDY0139191.1 CpsD/CapB family tyrosine-protein kinase [Candidatus Izemoplasmatales bacterium]